MSGGGFSAEVWVMAMIGLAVAVGVIRLVLWRRGATTEARGPIWRTFVLVGLQPVVGILLYFVLFPPGVVFRTGTLIVATRGAPASIERAVGDVVVALPEASVIEGAARMPDLATAIRRFPGAARIRVEGEGLVPRDQTSTPMPLDFDPPPRARGLIDLALPDPVTPGSIFSVGGQIGTLSSGVVELVDPANVVVDRARVTAGQRFVVTANAREAGLALFGLRLSDATGMRIEQVAVPIETRAQTQPRVLVLAGAPGPETKYLRRWAEDAGIDLGVQIEVGGGIQLGDPPVVLNRATLSDIDLVVIDDRRWNTLDAGARSALVAAVDQGLGLLLRPTGPLSTETRRAWAALGVPLGGGDDSLPLKLDAASPAKPPADEGEVATETPDLELARRDLVHEGPRAISFLRDADGVALASWRTRGRGRIGIWTVTDSYALVLTGRPDRYGEMWSELFSALARTGDDSRVRIDGMAQAGTRLAVCGVDGAARILDPDGVERALRIDPASGDQACAAYWPERSGWHLVRDGRGRETIFYVHPIDTALSLIASENREATLALATMPPSDRSSLPPQRTRVSPWPWFGALLATLALLWWLERRRFVRGKPDPLIRSEVY